jgi:hypothetical protein
MTVVHASAGLRMRPSFRFQRQVLIFANVWKIFKCHNSIVPAMTQVRRKLDSFEKVSEVVLLQPSTKAYR